MLYYEDVARSILARRPAILNGPPANRATSIEMETALLRAPSYIYISLYSALESLARKIKTHPREYFLYSLLQLKIDFLLVLISEIDKYIYFFFHFFTTLQINIRKLS